ncbi:NADH-quinone oxidoreductase subunit C [Campylobacter sp. RM12327]|uniref:NADH-quinone oxidoreductase subunit C n=1 Tax=Campylobacter sputorum TaxID=206 RepID=UPI000B77BF56|nr:MULTISPECIES: NADH-quinone oxidoreductase subunit C [Campylobacter]ASM40802.1 NADH:quinone oxidoreductase I, chain C [Campylobacter sputorum]MBE7357890.1 NADH-quinone oxidoreductase subunit C [Campylobacter sp. RM11302]MBF6669683.1 NADH-quinone oxidoreductase subunit C [Campylobacter sp. RM12327]MBF6674826.1 NADH-quinone oxidoreductase subunit C [Campylobacter sp. RM13538]MBF6675736.1 NADH-quinone oxidoreductase subunit C [Campylobacter sp. RM12321]
MRRYSNLKDTSKKNYYKDRFFKANQTQKIDPLQTFFKDEINTLTNFNIINSYVEFNTLVIYINSIDNVDIITSLKNFGYEMLCEMSGIDFIAQKNGIEVFYELLSISKKRRVRVKTFVKTDEMLKSVANIYKSANWAERELYDMMGVLFKNHPNLKRLIMPDDWFDHPLRKSYPLQGDERAKWYEIDTIYGKDFRNVVGEENRDSGFVDSKDTFNFSMLYHETPKGEDRPIKPYKQEYQEENGVKFVKKIKRDNCKILDKRP